MTDRQPVTTTLARKRITLALLVAVISDALSFWTELILPVQWLVDGMTAVLLFLILGRQWALLPALVAEAIPGVAMFPAWVLVVGAIGMWGQLNPTGLKR